jgi:pimeloyl-ACP methyl ester carboxylesterase
MGTMTVAEEIEVSEEKAIRPFRIKIPQEQLVDLRRRIAATRWPEKETVSDPSQGVQLATIQALARYWGTEYDWRKVEARLNALPQFITEIDGLDIHFLHVRSQYEDALPLIVTHGWPGSIIEQMKIIDPLTNPTAHGASASDAFHLVIPSLPGYGFSGKPATTGWDPAHIARAWVELMKRLGYTRFVASGGDWGAMISDVMATQAPPELLGIHITWPFLVPPDIDKAIQAGSPLPSDLSADELRACERLDSLYKHGLGYAQEMSTRPQTMYAMADSAFFAPKHVAIPVAFSAFPDEVFQAPQSWAQRTYAKLVYYRRHDKGGHFAAWEQPELYSEDVRAGFRSLRGL